MTSTPLAPLPAMAPPDPARPRPPYRFIGTLAWLGAALLTGGTMTAVTAAAVAYNGVALALSGFSAATMLATTVSGALVLVLMVMAAAWSWRRAVTQRP